MDTQQRSAEELSLIRKMMEESSRFLSLSGLSGIFAGVTAIVGSIVAYFLILGSRRDTYEELFRRLLDQDNSSLRWQISLIALLVLVIALSGSTYFSMRKARQTGVNIWTPMSRRFLLNLLIPLVTGGLFILILLMHDQVLWIAPSMLIFYGLALVNAGKFTFGEIFYLGLLQIMLGLLAALFPSQGLLFWATGFGVLHIVYGLFMYRKYEA